jgi:hypothetical protein
MLCLGRLGRLMISKYILRTYVWFNYKNATAKITSGKSERSGEEVMIYFKVLS